MAISRMASSAGVLTDVTSNATAGALTSFSFNPGTGSFVVLGVGGWRDSTATMTFTPTIGGVTPAAVGPVVYGTDAPLGNSFFQWWVLAGVSSGAKTIAANWASSANSQPKIRIAALAYSGVGSYSGLIQTGGSEIGTALSQTVPTALGNVVAQMFMQEPAFGGTLSGYNQTPIINPFDTGLHGQGILGEAVAGGSSVTFTAVRGGGANYLESAFNMVPTESAALKSNMFLVI